MSDRQLRTLRDVKLGDNVRIYDFVNLYECEIGNESSIGTFVEIQKGARIGRRVKVSSHTFVCEGVTIEDDVFVGHNVSFINDKYPRATTNGRRQTSADWTCVPTLVKQGASIGTSATIMCGVTIGENAIIGAGSVVMSDVPANTVVAGVPARILPSRPESPKAVAKDAGDVPFIDLKAQYRTIKAEIGDAIGDVLESTSFVLGEHVRKFEDEFAAYSGSQYGVGVNSGTSAIHLALLAAGVGPGDEVLTVPFTFVGTVAAILYTGARPVFVDIDPRSFNMDPDRIERAITSRTKAILPVHLYGQAADLDPIGEIANRRGLTLIEDAAQAHGTEYKGRRAGSFGALACFSFYPGKNLGAYGEGGMVVTQDAGHARMLRMLRDWGAEHKYQHVLKGYNYRMDAIQGAVLRVKLRHLEGWTAARRQVAARYDAAFAVPGIQTPVSRRDSRHVYHVYAIRTPRREALQQALASRGIRTGIHYPVPVHLQPAYSDLGWKEGDFPESEKAAREVLSLPMFAELTGGQVERVITAVRESAGV